ncbi:hypothetical protein, partial [Acinetobacter baumannii]|uniref:hypothetical protein n=1 Tax=Acinetobacter baumannii TaxID=470 RepID=UPI001896B8FC
DEVTKAVGKLDEFLSKGKSLTSAFSGLDFKMPDMKMPDMKMPSIGRPDIKTPDTSSISGLAAPLAGLTEGLSRLKRSSEDVANSGIFNPQANLDTSQIVAAGENTSVAAEKMAEAKSVLGDFGAFLQKIGGWIADFFEGFDAEDLMA